MQKERAAQFLELFNGHVDPLFSRCLEKFADREQALLYTREAFLRSWDKIARGEEMQAAVLYNTLDVLLGA